MNCPTIYPEVTYYSREAPAGLVAHNVPCGGTLRTCAICGQVRYCGREGRCLNDDQPTHWQRQRFNIDDVFDGGFIGWTKGEHWNGWACPYFERDVALALVDAQNVVPVSKAWYDAALDAVFVQFDNETDDDPQRYDAEVIQTSDGPKTVYPIGAGSWVWDAEAL